MTRRDCSDYIRVLLYSYHTTTTGLGVHLKYPGVNAGTSMKLFGG